MKTIDANKIEAAKKQSEFCADLMNRLNEEIRDAGVNAWTGQLSRYTGIENDIARLRRELQELRKMLKQ